MKQEEGETTNQAKVEEIYALDPRYREQDYEVYDSVEPLNKVSTKKINFKNWKRSFSDTLEDLKQPLLNAKEILSKPKVLRPRRSENT